MNHDNAATGVAVYLRDRNLRQAQIEITRAAAPPITYTLPTEVLLQELPTLLSANLNEDLAAVGAAGMSSLVLTPPHLWQVNALATFGYAFHERGGQKVAVGLWGPTAMALNYRDDEGGFFTYNVVVPDRVVVGLWEGEHLYIGGVYLCRPQEVPRSIADPNAVLRPWHLGNVNGSGGVCFGTANRPVFGLDGVTGIHDAFFSAAFNWDIPAPALVEGDDGDDEDEGRARDLRSYVESAGDGDQTPLNFGSNALGIQEALTCLAAAPW